MITDTFCISWGLGAVVCYIFGSKSSKKTNDVWKSPVHQLTYSVLVFVLKKPNTLRPGQLT